MVLEYSIIIVLYSPKITLKSTSTLAIIVYCAVRGIAPQYLSLLLHRIAELPPRRRLRSFTSDYLIVPSSRLVSVGDQSFAAAARRL